MRCRPLLEQRLVSESALRLTTVKSFRSLNSTNNRDLKIDTSRHTSRFTLIFSEYHLI